MISVTTINRSKAESILFIHGLFATAGFWLPYMHFFRGYRLDFLNVDFVKLAGHLDTGLEEVVKLASELAPRAVVCHSLGCTLGHHIDHPNTYLICDVSQALRSDPTKFTTVIEEMVGEDATFVRSGLQAAELYYQRISNNHSSTHVSFTPDSDEFFIYGGEANFCGTHFEVTKAVADISGRLNES